MKKPLVSLIIPMYNAEKYIERCIQCIKQQTYQHLEIIFVDDGSTDHTVELCKKYTNGLFRVKIICTKNRGVSAARNIGLDNAHGEYIAFADVDDYFFEDYIGYLVWLIIKGNADIAISELTKSKSVNSVRYNTNKNRLVYKYTSEQAIADISYRKRIAGSVTSKLIKKDLAVACRLNENLAYYEDYIYICDVLQSCKSIIVGERINYLYMQHSESATHNYDHNKCLQSWGIVINKLNEYECAYPSIKKAFDAKAMLVSIDILKKVRKCGYDESRIREEIYRKGLNVVKDKNVKMIKRIYVLASYIDFDLLFVISERILKILALFNIYINVG